jgi:hypothetical protein
MRWTKDRWNVSLCEHHDHIFDHMRIGVDFSIQASEVTRNFSFPGRTPDETLRSFVRFPGTIICGNCNAADGSAKKKLGLPEWFSFSPSEIATFVKASPNAPHVIDYQTALAIYGHHDHGRYFHALSYVERTYER